MKERERERERERENERKGTWKNLFNSSKSHVTINLVCFRETLSLQVKRDIHHIL